MSQVITKKKRGAASLRASRTARTVLLRMAADEARAQRIRDLKDRHPEIKWRHIAARMGNDGITERAAQEWRVTGGLKYEHAQELNRIFQEAGEQIPDDFIWRGEPTTPDPFRLAGQMDGGFEEFRTHVAALHARFDQLESAVADARIERDAVIDLLERQSAVLKRIERLVSVLRDVEVESRPAADEDEPLPQDVGEPPAPGEGEDDERDARAG